MIAVEETCKQRFFEKKRAKNFINLGQRW